MGPRPAHLDFSQDASDTRSSPKMNFQLDLPSPRTGEVPPALSPLDAFALQSRLLAKQFEQQAQGGRRLSRLPHGLVAKELANRPEFFRQPSDGSYGGMGDVNEVHEETSPMSPTSRRDFEIAPAQPNRFRPISHYPQLSTASTISNVGPARDGTPVGTQFYDAHESQPPAEAQEYFGIPRAVSPEPVDHKFVNVEAPTPQVPSLTNSVDSVQSSFPHPRSFTNDSTRSQRSLQSDRGGLLQPKSPAYPPRSPRSIQGIRQVRSGSGDGEAMPSGSEYMASRKFSSSSTRSRPQSPFSPYMHPVPRSPSVNSDYSMTGSHAHMPRQKPQNFSRPMSSGGRSQTSADLRPSMDSRPSFETRSSTDLPCRDPSISSNSTRPVYSATHSRQNSGDDVRTPYINDVHETPLEEGTQGGDYFSGPDHENSSYIYSKYTLPRGRSVDRTSAESRDSWIQKQFHWDESRSGQKPPMRPLEEDKTIEKQRPSSLEDSRRPRLTAPVRPPSPAGSTSSTTSERISGMRLSGRDRIATNSSNNRSRSANPDARSPLHQSSASVSTGSTGRTVRPKTTSSDTPTTSELSPDQHLEIGIQAHTSGSLQKSTYHLRLAANGGQPTGMLLYALACRHGWGMRPNQEEGVKWLKKAIDGSSLEMVDVEAAVSAVNRHVKADPVAEAQERRKRKAQFALAIYELGISYMNGWGCSKDRALALRCYEVAGNWGDTDALAEAGFCYTQGLGCKKDMKKAAQLYRKAAEMGMSMAGNSWIYKSKYDEAPKTKTPEKKKLERVMTDTPTENSTQNPTGRARSRSIWGKKKEKEKTKMSDSDWRPQGDGPHSTLAANVLDPGVKADGAMNAGQGVGGARPARQREEGLEHMKQNIEGLSGNTGVSGGQGSATGLGNSGSGVSGMGVGRSTYGSDVTPSSNPGAGDYSSGISRGAGGVSGAGAVNSPATGSMQQDQQGVAGTVNNYLGYDNTSGAQEPLQARNVEDYRSGDAGSDLSNRGEAAGLGAGTLGAGAAGAGASQYDRDTRDQSYNASSTAGTSYRDSPATQKESTTMGSAPERETEAGSGAPRPTDSDVTTGAPPTEAADPTSKVPVDRSAGSNDKTEEGRDKPKKVSDREAATRENIDAIPTAGGEKLGEKHWGESKRVPDVPAKRDDAGISSEDGQSDSTTRDNTAKNIGGGSNPHDSSGHDGTGKESFVDKVKEKLHIGHKDKS
ncbi:hypothetical protein Tdes44962_MAKER03612 [Teratosphaeria destructans]|uniref:Uncharacterized protein n=1 Tax=Teratosphaeria destructans TaxID=418781 RepID=A0A9W7SQ14_9PEZI|nr:hypothetical protein Tdes44962_MAKER03612 [Teratosphaeria destructans]